MSTFDDILSAASALPDSDRARLVDALLGTFDPQDAAPLDDAWLVTIRERSREFDEGLVTPIPWEEVKANAARRTQSHE